MHNKRTALVSCTTMQETILNGVGSCDDKVIWRFLCDKNDKSREKKRSSQQKTKSSTYRIKLYFIYINEKVPPNVLFMSSGA